jgi:hypothetical protein
MSTGEQPDPDRIVIDGDVDLDADDSAVEFVVTEDADGAPDDFPDGIPDGDQTPLPAASGRRWRPAVVLPLALLLERVTPELLL